MNKGSGKAMLGKNMVCTKAWGCQRKSLGLGGLERGSMWLQVRREHPGKKAAVETDGRGRASWRI